MIGGGNCLEEDSEKAETPDRDGGIRSGLLLIANIALQGIG